MNTCCRVFVLVAISFAHSSGQELEPWQTDWDSFVQEIRQQLVESAERNAGRGAFVLATERLPGFGGMSVEWAGRFDRILLGDLRIAMNSVDVDYGGANPASIEHVQSDDFDSGVFGTLSTGAPIRFRGILAAEPLEVFYTQSDDILTFGILIEDLELVTEGDPSSPGARPAISQGGIVLATGTPSLDRVSGNSIVTVYGRDFAPAGTSVLAPEVESTGRVATRLADTCVEVNGDRAPLFAVLSNQINFQVPSAVSLGPASVEVVRACGADAEARSQPQSVEVGHASPAFFNFVNREDGRNPIAATHGGGPDLVGPDGLLGENVVTTPARAGEVISLFATGLGATNPSFTEGEIPQVVNPSSPLAPVVGSVRVFVDGIELTSADILYVGAAPCCAGLYQLVLRLPDSAPDGDLAVAVIVDGVSSPDGPFVNVSGSVRGDGQDPVVTAVVNEGSGLPFLSPGVRFLVRGRNLTDGRSCEIAELPAPTELCGANVFAAGLVVPIMAADPGRVLAQMPFGIDAGPAELVVRSSGKDSEAYSVTLETHSPGIFLVGDVMLDPISGDNPAIPGEVVLIVAVGLGPVDPPATAGEAAGVSPLHVTVESPIVRVGETVISGDGILFSGLLPGFNGYYSINFVLPEGIPGGQHDLSIEIGGQQSASTPFSVSPLAP